MLGFRAGIFIGCSSLLTASNIPMMVLHFKFPLLNSEKNHSKKVVVQYRFMVEMIYFLLFSQSDSTDNASAANPAAAPSTNAEPATTNGSAAASADSTQSGHLRRPSQSLNNNGSGNGTPTFAVPNAPAPTSNYATM